MKKHLSIILVLVMVFSVALLGCGKKESAVDVKDSKEFATLDAELTMELVGSITRDDFMTCSGGLYYKDDNGKYGVMSLDGRYDTGAIYGYCATRGKYFVVSNTQAANENDLAGINSCGMIDGTGRMFVPMGYASFTILNDRFVQAMKVTQRTNSKDEALVYMSNDDFSVAPDEDDVYYKGTWVVYDIETGRVVPGVSGNGNSTVIAYGDYVVYYNDADERITVDANGTQMTNDEKVFDDGSYSITGRVGSVFDSEGNHLFDYDLTGFCPTSSEGDYYVASKYEDGDTKYVVMDKTGKVISAEFKDYIQIYGELIHCDEKIYNMEGKNIVKGSYSSVTYDSIFGGCWLLYKDDVYTMITEDGSIVFQGAYNDDYNVYSTDFVANKKTDDGTFYYSHKDKDYTIKGYSFAPWFVETSNANGMYDIVNTISGETVLEGYKDYSYTDAYNTLLYVYAKYDGGADIYAVLGGKQVLSMEEKKENLLEDLVAAFKAAGISVTVNEETGEIFMDSSVLFGGDSAALTAEGKAFLNKFIKAYTSIVFSDKYDGFISRTMVEGHIAPVAGSTYQSGLQLSEERAKNVMNYCLSAEAGVDTAKLANTLQAIGFSNSKPIIKADGSIDMDASRRVTFRFVVDVQ